MKKGTVKVDKKRSKAAKKTAKLYSGDNFEEGSKEEYSGLMYSPVERIRISEAAYDGRAMLGMSAVNPKQLMSAAYSAILAKDGTDSWTFKKWMKKGCDNYYTMKIHKDKSISVWITEEKGTKYEELIADRQKPTTYTIDNQEIELYDIGWDWCWDKMEEEV